VTSIKAAIKKGPTPHAWLFTGPSGCGKTTLARIVADMVGCAPDNVLEVDAATNTGIDAMREVSGSLRYLGFGDSPARAVIIDECHALSTQAWQSLLKVIEEPPSHAYFMLCTTNPSKVPQTVITRCANYQVRELVKDDVWDLLESVCESEGFKTSEDVLRVVVSTAEGSARRALSALQMVHDCRDAKEASLLLSQPFEDAEVIELLRDMVSGARLDWVKCLAVLTANKDADPEGLRLMIVNYLSAVLLNAKDARRAGYLLDCLAQFMRPVQRSEKMAGLLLAFGNLALPKD
jgi:DNA polymerase III gamma/tau subunit